MIQWSSELVTLEYKDPLFNPSLLTQSVLASISSSDFHSFVIDFDLLAFLKLYPFYAPYLVNK